MIERRQRELIRTLWMHGRLSRWELHEQTGFSPNGVGTTADTLLRAGLIRECAPEAAKMGRPRVPLELDPASRHVIGLALGPGRVEICRLGITGDLLGPAIARKVDSPSSLVKTAAAMLSEVQNEKTLAIGITSPGFLDPALRSVLFSSALPGRGVESLEPIFSVAGKTPAVLGNDMHALAARWLLTHRAEASQDVLLVSFGDGHLGAAILIEGRPNRGSAIGANELGHTRFPDVETDRCYCGQFGCLEQIVSSRFLQLQDARDGNGHPRGPLDKRAAAFQTREVDPALTRLLDLLSHSLANAANFLRPHRLVLASPFDRYPAFVEALRTETRSLVLSEVANRLAIDVWNNTESGSAEDAGWLSIAELLYGGWDAVKTLAGHTRVMKTVGA